MASVAFPPSFSNGLSQTRAPVEALKLCEEDGDELLELGCADCHQGALQMGEFSEWAWEKWEE